MRLDTKIASVCAACVLACVLAAASGDTPARVANLSAKVGELHARGTAFSGVIDGIRNETGQNIAVNWRALKASHITRDLPVTVELSNLPLSQAIDRMLDRVGGPYVRLGYSIDEGEIIISTAGDLCRDASTRVYDVRAAVKVGPNHDQDVQAIIRRVEGVDPLSWKQYGGGLGDVRELGGQLIVTATPEVQNLVANELRDVLPTPPVGGSK